MCNKQINKLQKIYETVKDDELKKSIADKIYLLKNKKEVLK